MAATGTPTPNLGLRIPIGTDPASVDDINYNSNLLDTKLGAVGSDSVQDQIDTLNSNMTPSRRKIENNGTVCWVTSIGKLRVFSFDDDAGKIPATGLAIGETFMSTYRSACKYYNGTSNVAGMLYLNMDGTLYVGDLTSVNPKKDGTYVVGEIVAVAN